MRKPRHFFPIPARRVGVIVGAALLVIVPTVWLLKPPPPPLSHKERAYQVAVKTLVKRYSAYQPCPFYLLPKNRMRCT